MPHGRQKSPELQFQAITPKKAGHSIPAISLQLKSSRKVISNFLRAPDSYGTRKKRCYRRKMTIKDKKRLAREASKISFILRTLRDSLQVPISAYRNRLYLSIWVSLRYQRVPSIPTLTDAHKKARMNWAKWYVQKESQFWVKVLFTDGRGLTAMAPTVFSTTGTIFEKKL